MIPLVISGRIETISAGAYVNRKDGNFISNNSYSICFRADREVNVALENFGHISEHTIDLSLFCGNPHDQELCKDFSDNEIGFLSFSRTNGGIHIGGAACWPGSESFLLFAKASPNARIMIYINNAKAKAAHDSPFAWLPQRESALKISSLNLSAGS